MKIFRTVRKRYEILGITPTNQSIQKSSISERVIAGCLFFLCYYVSQFLYIYYVANDFMEYIECICELYASAIVFVCFATIVFKRNLLFQSIGNIEKLIDTSMAAVDYIIHDSKDLSAICMQFKDVSIRNQKHCSLGPISRWND